MVGVRLGAKSYEGDGSFPNIYERDLIKTTDISDYESNHIMSSILLDQRDDFYDMLMALETNFNLEVEELLQEDNYASTSTT